MTTDPALAPALDALRAMGGLRAEQALSAEVVMGEQNHLVAAKAMLNRAGSEEIPAHSMRMATMAATHATLALEAQVKRIADALEHMDALQRRQ